MDCPDYRNYMQLSLFPSLVPDKQIRRKLCSEKEVGDAGPVSKPPEQMSWLEKPDSRLAGQGRQTLRKCKRFADRASHIPSMTPRPLAAMSATEKDLPGT